MFQVCKFYFLALHVLIKTQVHLCSARPLYSLFIFNAIPSLFILYKSRVKYFLIEINSSFLENAKNLVEVKDFQCYIGRVDVFPGRKHII